MATRPAGWISCSKLDSPHAEARREMGVFGQAVALRADASLQDRLLGLTDRDPTR